MSLNFIWKSEKTRFREEAPKKSFRLILSVYVIRKKKIIYPVLSIQIKKQLAYWTQWVDKWIAFVHYYSTWVWLVFSLVCQTIFDKRLLHIENVLAIKPHSLHSSRVDGARLDRCLFKKRFCLSTCRQKKCRSYLRVAHYIFLMSNNNRNRMWKYTFVQIHLSWNNCCIRNVAIRIHFKFRNAITL